MCKLFRLPCRKYSLNKLIGGNMKLDLKAKNIKGTKVRIKDELSAMMDVIESTLKTPITYYYKGSLFGNRCKIYVEFDDKQLIVALSNIRATTKEACISLCAIIVNHLAYEN